MASPSKSAPDDCFSAHKTTFINTHTNSRISCNIPEVSPKESAKRKPESVLIGLVNAECSKPRVGVLSYIQMSDCEVEAAWVWRSLVAKLYIISIC